MSEQNAVKNDLSMAQEISALRSRVAILEEELAFAQDQLSWLKKQIFGRRTEQASVIMDALQLSLFPEEQKSQVQPKPETVTVPEHKRRTKRTHDDWMETLAIEEVKHQEEHPVCESCGAEMKEIGKEKAYDELVFTPANYQSAGISYIPTNAPSAAKSLRMIQIIPTRSSAAISAVLSTRSP